MSTTFVSDHSHEKKGLDLKRAGSDSRISRIEPARKALGVDSGNASFEAQTDGCLEDRELHRIRAIVEIKAGMGRRQHGKYVCRKAPK